MKVNIGRIREIIGGVVNFEGYEKLDLSFPEIDFNFTAPVEIKGTVTNTGGDFLVQADIFFNYSVSCGRCLENFHGKQKTELKEQFIPGFFSAKDDSAIGFTGDYIDIKDQIQEQVLLALPMNYICRPDCRGLCPVCGQNLNIKACLCQEHFVNPQFEKLKTLLSTEGGGINGKSKE